MRLIENIRSRFGWIFLLLAGFLAVATAQGAPEPAGWYSGDIHVHRSCGGSPVTVQSIYNAANSVGLSVVSLLADMGNGEVQNATTDLPKVNGLNDPVSTASTIVHWDAEWHWDATYFQYAHQALGGHIVALGLTNAAQVWEENTHRIFQWAHARNGVAGFAHLQYLDNGLPQNLTCCTPIEYPVEVALGDCDFISEDVAGADSAMNAYYRLLNCGLRPGFAGGSDYPCAANIGDVLTYVQVPGTLTYRKWVDGIAAGRTVVSRNSRREFIDFKVNSTNIPGDEINLASAGNVSVAIQWTATQNYSGTIELVQNGDVVASQSVNSASSGTLNTSVTFTNSGWLCARRMGGGSHQVHSAAIFVIVNGAPIRTDAGDAQFYVQWMNTLLTNTSPGGPWNSYFPTKLAETQGRFIAARNYYQQVADEAAALQPLSIATTNLPGGVVNLTYSTTLGAAGGTSPYGWSILTGSLPPGLGLNTNSGVISGTPTSSGTFNFNVRVTDSSGPAHSATSAVSIAVSSALAPGTFGNTNNGTSADYIWDVNPYINAGRFLAASNMTVSMIQAKIMGVTGKYKCAIYSDNGGVPNQLLRTTSELTNPATGWQIFPMSSALALLSGNYYWLAIWSDSPNAEVFFSSTSGGTLRWRQNAYGNWPDPITTSGGNSYSYCIYAFGTTAGPTLPAQSNRIITETTSLTVTNTGTLGSNPGPLTYSLSVTNLGNNSVVTNANISSNGIITWTPTEGQGPGSNRFWTVVTDAGAPPLSATNSFIVTVSESNSPPILPSQTNRIVAELSTLIVTNSATETDLPPNAFSYQLINPPAGALINTNGVITWTPTEAQGPATNTITTVVTDNGVPPLSATNSFAVTVTEVNSAPTLPVLTNRTIVELTTLTVTNAATDGDLPANALSYQLINPPSGAAISSNGIITWTPAEGQGPSTNTLTTVVTDNGSPTLTATNFFVVTVTESNSPPLLPVQTNQSVAELSTLIVTNSATQTDLPPNAFTYQLIAPPAGAAIDTNGVITWTPTEAQGPATNTITTVVTDNGVPPLSATNSFTVTVTEVNSVPTLPVQTNRTIVELATLTVTNTATDGDLPANALNYQLISPPAGMVINSNGVITWTPAEGQGPGTNTITTVVTDNGSPALSATNSFVVTVTELNSPPVLPAQTNQTILELSTLVVTNSATETDLPPNSFTYQLVNPPAGAAIDTNGVITWTPTEAQGPVTNTLTTVVTDNGVPPLSATNSFLVTVSEVNSAPTLPVQTNLAIAELTTLIVTNSASDADVPANVLSYQLINPPAGAAIDTNGVITWTPTEGQGPVTNTITTVVTDSGVPPLSATNLFVVTVDELNSAPTLPVQTNHVIAESTTLIVTNTASDVDVPANTLAYQLINPPAGAVIDTNGVITWTPGEAQGPSTNTITTVATDNGVPGLTATNSFVVTVAEVNLAPILPLQSNRTILELTTLTVTNAASDADVPGNSMTYQLINPPAGAAIDTNGVITWTPTEAQSPVTNRAIITVATDSGVPSLSATNSFLVTVDEVNSAPALLAQTNHVIAESTALIVTNTASDLDLPVNALTYQLVNPPAGAVIDTNGVITWTPTEAQGPVTNTITTVVTDNGIPALSATNSFVVTVNEVNSAPTLPVQTNRVIAELTTLTVTNTAADVDQPLNALSYQLINPPAGAAIDTNGVITWTPTEAQGPVTNTITTVVTDDGIPALSATNSFVVTVNEVNSAPTLPAQTNHVIAELTTLTVTNIAGDVDQPLNTLTYQLINPPVGAVIDTNGVITWTPTEAQGPVTNTITTVVTDNGIPALSATNSFVVTVNEVNSAPTLPAQTNHVIAELTTLTVTNIAGDVDQPLNTLTYQLVNPPVGAVIDTNGVITWTPTEAQGPVTNTITTVVTDNGTPALSATNSFVVTVNEVNSTPTLPVQTNVTIAELTTLTVTNTASDVDQPLNALSYQLINPPAGAAIDTNGVITWTPTEAQGPVTNTITTVVTDNGIPALTATNSFVVTVNEANSAPTLPVQTNYVIAELTALVVTNTASDLDLPGNTLTYQLLNPPAGAVIDASGVITWTPTEAQGPVTNTITTVVTDDGVPSLSATNSFVVTVIEVNSSPTLPVQSDRTITALTTLTVTNSASDPDLPANLLTYQLINPPVGAAIDSSGVITWTPLAAQSPSTNTITTVVTDDGLPALSATNTFAVFVNPPPPLVPPTIESIVVAAGTAWVRWSTVTGQVYRLQYKDNLNGTTWTDLFPNISGTGSPMTFTNAAGIATQRFYRVLVIPPP